MAECCGLVLLDQEMSGEREAIADRNPQQRPPGMMREEGGDSNREAEKHADGMHAAIAGIAVFAQVELEKFFVIAKLGSRGHRYHPLSAQCTLAGGVDGCR